MPPYSLKSFDPLSQERIDEIIGNTRPELVAQVAHMAQEAITQTPQYAELIAGYGAEEDKRAYIETHQQKMAEFLNDCGLMGYGHERSTFQHDNFVIGAEGMELIVAYLKDKKAPNQRLHEIVTVKNENLLADDGSRKHSNIFLQDPDHKALTRRLREDIAAAGGVAGAFEKTYVIEVFGTTGGNHGAMLTVRKAAGEEAPLVHFFDPSPSLIRNGLEATQNSIACGWNAHLIIGASVKKAFEAEGLKFDNDKYFNNSEPQQHRGYVYCGTFAYEASNRLAAMTREQHEELLDSYLYKSPFGGKTEMAMITKGAEGRAVDLDIDRIREEGGYVEKPVFGLNAEEVIASQFVEPALSSRAEELAEITHHRKPGREAETELDHVRRYQLTEEEAKAANDPKEQQGFNSMMGQKALRQKIGHLFEIVASEQFLARAGAVGLEENPFQGVTPYFPKGNANENPQIEGAKGIIDAINTNLPMQNRINRAEFDGEVCRVEIYLGEMTGKKVSRFFSENGITPVRNIIDLSRNLPDGIDPALRKIDQYVIEIPRERFAEFEDKMAVKDARGNLQPKVQFYAANKANSFYPQPSAGILPTQTERLVAAQQQQIN